MTEQEWEEKKKKKKEGLPLFLNPLPTAVKYPFLTDSFLKVSRCI